MGEWADRDCNENRAPGKEASGKAQSHQRQREIYAGNGADPALVNVIASLYPNRNGLWIRLEDSVFLLLQYANCWRAACGIAMQEPLPAERVCSALHAAPSQSEWEMPSALLSCGAQRCKADRETRLRLGLSCRGAAAPAEMPNAS